MSVSECLPLQYLYKAWVVVNVRDNGMEKAQFNVGQPKVTTRINLFCTANWGTM